MKASPAVGTVVCLVAVQLACLGLVAVVWPGRLQSHRARDLAALIQQHGAAAAAAQSGGDAIRLPGQSLPAAAALARTGGGSATAKTLHRIVDQNPITRTSHYTCMEPVTGLSSPVVTVLTAAEFPDKYTVI